MSLLALPDELLSHILEYLHLPRPKAQTACTRKDYHQQDLTSVLLLNKRLYHLSGRVLYTHPVVDNPHGFFLGIQCSSSISKRTLLTHVKNLDLTHHQSLMEEPVPWRSIEKGLVKEPNTYSTMSREGRGLWEEDVLSNSLQDLENCRNAAKILQWAKDQNIDIMPNLAALSVGAYDGGWWADKMKQMKDDYGGSRNSSAYPNKASDVEPPRKLWMMMYNGSALSFKFATLLLDTTHPSRIHQYLIDGPLSPTNALGRSGNPKLSSAAFHLDFHQFRRDYSFQPLIIEGSLNQWFIKASHTEGQIGDCCDGLMFSLQCLLDRLQNCRPKSNNDDSSGEETVLEIYDLNNLEHKEFDELGRCNFNSATRLVDEWFAEYDQNVLRGMWPGQYDRKEKYPARISPKPKIKTEYDRFGPWGVLEYRNNELSFVDIRVEERRFTIRFKKSGDENR